MKLSIRRLRQWFVEILRWLSEGKIVFMCLIVIATAIFLGVFTWRSEESIRLAGYFLQLIGMVFAIRGLLRVRAHFGQTPLRRLFIAWLKRFPKWRRNVVIGVGAANIALSGMKARIEVWAPDNPSDPVEKRIEGIVKNLEIIRNELRGHDSSIEELKDSHEEHKKLVAEQTKRLEKDIHTDLESLHTSDLITSLVGLVWLTVGITMSTLAPELYAWL